MSEMHQSIPVIEIAGKRRVVKKGYGRLFRRISEISI
jgi:hypothetical protein